MLPTSVCGWGTGSFPDMFPGPLDAPDEEFVLVSSGACTAFAPTDSRADFGEEGGHGPSMAIRATKASIAPTTTSHGRVRGWPGSGASTNKTESEPALGPPNFWARIIKWLTNSSGR